MDFKEKLTNIKKTKLKNDEKIGLILFAIGLIYLFIMSYIGLTRFGVWSDEIFTFSSVLMPFNDFIYGITTDVHPPLYYFILKFFIKIFSFLQINNIMFISKFVSLIPIYLLVILSATKIRKEFGLLCSGIFTLCITSMPQLMIYGVEIRMYGFALLFMTASLIYTYEIIKNSNLKNWAILTILTICSAYTHYFSAMASGVLYLLLIAYILYKNRQLVKYWIASSVLIILAYIPWLPSLKYQLTKVNTHYWIEAATFDSVIGYIYYVLSPVDYIIRGNEITSPTILGTLLLIGIIAIIIYYLKGKKDLNGNFAIFSLLAFILVPVVGLTISVLFKPIFHVRYLVPILGLLWLGVSILLSKTYEIKKIFIPILVVIMIVGVVGTSDFINIENAELVETTEKNDVIHDVFGENNIIIFDDYFLYYKNYVYYFSSHENILVGTDNASETIDFGVEVKNVLNRPEVQEKIANGSKVYFIDRYDPDYETCLKEGVELKEVYVDEYDAYTAYEVILN
ncbi:hypothetical protein [Methanobrevibacter sp. DSM 116169]|uniref:glycosyltransferase family 39 protein n=1 Tax=Methanobrevibacter sp. DSM 116169 TaxID=3242727 RepID=UPI0038FCA413